MSTAPNPIVVRVFAKGGVDFVPLQQAIAHDLKCLMEGRPDDASTIAGVFNNSIEAAAYVPALKRTLREAREKRATEADAAAHPEEEKPVCSNCQWPLVKATPKSKGLCCINRNCIKFAVLVDAKPAAEAAAASSGDRNTTDQNIPVNGNHGGERE